MPKQRKEERINIHTKLRFLVLDYITKTPNLPEHIKPQVKQNMVNYVNFIASYLGTLELLWRRTKDIVKEKNKAQTKKGPGSP